MANPPVVPPTITVHLGSPGSDAPNVTVPFIDYIKNVASSEVYPTWPEAALRANIYAQISFALNRIYTEWYRSRGYDFDITNSTAYDQSFQYGRDTFDRTDRIVEQIFNQYVVRQGDVEPLFTAYCNGTTTTCDGLSQWGTVTLANEGRDAYGILQYYFGDDINIEQAPVISALPSYPGTPLRKGDSGDNVYRIQRQLNRVSINYPAIPRITNENGYFGDQTEAAVRKYQQIFSLLVDGIVGKETWYSLNATYSGVKRLAELQSEGEEFSNEDYLYRRELKLGDAGLDVSAWQYALQTVAALNQFIPPLEVTGTFDQATQNSVRAFQQFEGLTETGTINRETAESLYFAYEAAIERLPDASGRTGIRPFPGTILEEGARGASVLALQNYLNFISDYDTSIPKLNADAIFGPLTRQAVIAFQQNNGLTPDGRVTPATWDAITNVYADLKSGALQLPQRFPGFDVGETNSNT